MNNAGALALAMRHILPIVLCAGSETHVENADVIADRLP